MMHEEGTPSASIAQFINQNQIKLQRGLEADVAEVRDHAIKNIGRP